MGEEIKIYCLEQLTIQSNVNNHVIRINAAIAFKIFKIRANILCVKQQYYYVYRLTNLLALMHTEG